MSTVDGQHLCRNEYIAYYNRWRPHRRVLNLAARVWRHENGLTWLETSPLLQMVADDDARKPYPLTWEEQTRLFKELPAYLERMALFKVNTGLREQEVCKLRWRWEVKVPGLETTVF